MALMSCFHATVLALALSASLFGQDVRLEFKSPLGRDFHSLPDEKGVVAAAEKALAENPKDVKLILKLSQAHAAVWEDKEAVAACTRGLVIDPDNVDLLVERGHRELPLRKFIAARQDLERAATLDPKQSEAFYHLGLAHYFLDEFALAADAFSKGRDLVNTQDSLVNFTNWCYVALRRAGKKEEAAKALEKVPADMQSNAGHTAFYFNLVRFYQGRKSEAEVVPPAPQDPADTEAELAFDTIAYQMGNWQLYNGNAAKAKEYFERVSKGHVWVTWGFVGSEIELARRKFMAAATGPRQGRQPR
jgi:tetratricopeptide (TPR) repeat protein